MAATKSAPISLTTPTSAKTAPHVPKSRRQRRKEKELSSLREKTTHILPSSSFKRVVCDLTPNSGTKFRYSKEAIQALQTAAENEMTKVFEGAAFCAEMGKRDTVTVQDMKNYMALRASMN